MLDYINHIENKDVPALVLLHGYGSNMQDLFSLKPYLPPVNIICLQAPKVLGHEAFAWYDINWNNGSKIIDSEEVNRVADEVQNTVSSWIDSNNLKGKLIIGGFSQGAILSLAMLKNAYNADGYVLMSGYMLPEWRDKIWEFDIPVLQTTRGSAPSANRQNTAPTNEDPNCRIIAKPLRPQLDAGLRLLVAKAAQ